MHIETNVGIRHADVGTLASEFHKIVDNGVLDFISNKLRIAEFCAVDCGVYGKGGVKIENFIPLNALDGFVNGFGIFGTEVENGLQHSDCGAQTEVSSVHHFLITGE